MHGLSGVCRSRPSVLPGGPSVESELATPVSSDELDRLAASATPCADTPDCARASRAQD